MPRALPYRIVPSCPPLLTLALGAALTLLSSGCASAVEHEYVSSWFRLEKTERTVFAPHVIEWGGGQSAQVDVDGDWTTVQRGDFSATRMGDAVAVRAWSPWSDTRPHRVTRVYIYHPGQVEPVAIPPQECPTPVVSGDPPALGCFSCRGRQALEEVRNLADCRELRVLTLDAWGRTLTDQIVASPIQAPSVEGRLPSGEWLLAETKASDDFLFFYGPLRRFIVTGGTLSELPYGSDPLSKDYDAAERAKKILAEVPVRDAALAQLAADHAAEEATRPERTLVDTTETHLREGTAVEPRVPARAGTCYEMVVRSSANIEQIKLFVGWDYSDIERSISRAGSPWIGQTATPSVARLQYCVQGRPSADLLEFRIEAGAGGGYVAARLYSYPAPAAPSP